MSKYAAIRHESYCYKNPQNHSCLTCGYSLQTTESSYDGFSGDFSEISHSSYKQWWCYLEEDNPEEFEGRNLKIHCENWKEREKLCQNT